MHLSLSLNKRTNGVRVANRTIRKTMHDAKIAFPPNPGLNQGQVIHLIMLLIHQKCILKYLYSFSKFFKIKIKIIYGLNLHLLCKKLKPYSICKIKSFSSRESLSGPKGTDFELFSI